MLVVGGSREIPGAVRLAAEAALRAGAGKLQIATARDVAVSLAIAVPEAKVIGLPVDRHGHIADLTRVACAAVQRADALLIGPGMDDESLARRVAAKLLRAARGTAILDAGALPAYRKPRSAPVIMTPHLGEMASITQMSIDRLTRKAPDVAREFAMAEKLTLVLKGVRTWIASADGRLWIHEGGTVGLGTSGSGDVLAGIIAGLAARGALPEQAAAWGVWLHACAGRTLSKRIGRIGFLARDLSPEIPALLR